MNNNFFQTGGALATPFYPEATLYLAGGGLIRPWEFNGWKAESLSWKKACYIHAGLSGAGQVLFTGPEALPFLSGICVNSFSNFPIGSAKHAVMCDEAGLICSHGVLQRNAEDEFLLFVSGLWASYQQSKTKCDVVARNLDNFLFQIAGPRSLEVLERATGESLRDLPFLRFRRSTVDGINVEVMRVGMAGTLAYELHGSMADAPMVYDAVFKAGAEFGIERLGWRTYTVNHVEAGYPQSIWTFTSAAGKDVGYLDYVNRIGLGAFNNHTLTGSVDPANLRARYRTPTEVGWQRTVKFDHPFVGREALEQEMAAPKRTIVTLVWNAEDVVDIYASLFRSGEEYKTIDLPTAPHLLGFLSHADRVLRAGKEIGVSSGTVYSYYFRQLISHCTIDVDSAALGTEVVVHWGDYGQRIKEVRATVARYPYLNEQRNQTFDTSDIPSGVRRGSGS